MSILTEAEEIIHGQRRTDYGGPAESFQRIADLWSPILGQTVTARDVALCMIQLKVSRYVHGQTRDSLVDIAGYAACIELVDAESADDE